MSGKPHYSSQQADAAVDLYRSGMSMRAAGAKAGINDQAVRRILDQRGVALRYQRPTYPEETIGEAVRLYMDERLSAGSVARHLGLKPFTVNEWISARGLIRSASHAATLAIARGQVRGRSRKVIFESAKSGTAFCADSTYEAVRMRQLDEDAAVAHWDRCFDRITYLSPCGRVRSYVPDLFVRYVDGSQVVEEVKPQFQIDTPINLAKFAAARAFYHDRSIEFCVISEIELGFDPKRYDHLLDDPSLKDQKALSRKLAKQGLARRIAAETPEKRRRRLDHGAAKARRLLRKRTASETAEERRARMERTAAAARRRWRERIDRESPESRRCRLDQKAAKARQDRRARSKCLNT